MVISSRTPEGTLNICPVCGSSSRIEPSSPSEDAPCPHCGNLLWFTWNTFDNTHVIKLYGNLTRPEMLDKVFESLRLAKGTTLVFDLEDIRYLSSALLSRLAGIAVKKTIPGIQGKPHIRNLHPEVREVFRICRLDQIFTIEP